jgi:hypothetical protein
VDSQETGLLVKERALLKVVAKSEASPASDTSALKQSLNELASMYTSYGRQDEYSAIRERMLDMLEKPNSTPHSPPYGGPPFPRIGLPGYKIEETKPRSLLSRWLNRKTLPKFYAQEQITFAEYAKIYQKNLAEAEKKQDSLSIAQNLEGEAALYCAQAKFPQAESLYLRALTIRDKASSLPHSKRSESLNNLIAIYRIEGKDADANHLEKSAQPLDRNNR